MRRALAGRWRARGATAAALAVVAAATLGMTGCGAAGPDDANAATAGKNAGENALPPGVLPPNDPPQPGDARLGPDGHYDYSAPDFVLKNPCDTEYFDRALELGWKVPEIGTKRRDEPDGADCTIVNDATGLALTTYPKSASGLNEAGYSVSLDSNQTPALLIVKGPSLFGESCFAGVETVHGAFGATTVTGGFSSHSTIEDACSTAIDTITQIIGGQK